MYIIFSKHVLFYFPFVPSISSVRRDFKVKDKNITCICNHQICDCADLVRYVDRLWIIYIVFTNNSTVDSRYLEIEGTIKNTSRYPYFDISDL